MDTYFRKEISESWEQALTVCCLLSKTSIQFRVVPHGVKLYFVFRDLRLLLKHPEHGTKIRKEFEKVCGRPVVFTANILEASHSTARLNMIALPFAERFILSRRIKDPVINEWQFLIKTGEFRRQLKEQLGVMYPYLYELDSPSFSRITKEDVLTEDHRKGRVVQDRIEQIALYNRLRDLDI